MQSTGWLPPLCISNTAIWVSPHTPVLSGRVPQRGEQMAEALKQKWRAKCRAAKDGSCN